MKKNVLALITLAFVGVAMAFDHSAIVRGGKNVAPGLIDNPALTAAEAAAALAEITLDPAEMDVLVRLFSDRDFRKAQAVVPVLKPAQDGDEVRCTLEPASGLPPGFPGAKGAIVAYFDKKGDKMRNSGFKKFLPLSILRFSGTVTFPFTAGSGHPSLGDDFYEGRDERGAKNGRKRSKTLLFVSLAPDTCAG